MKKLLLLTLISVLLTAQGFAQSDLVSLTGADHPRLTLQELKIDLAADKRNIREAMYEELGRLLPTPGGLYENIWTDEYVIRIGYDTFIIDMRLISGAVIISMIIVLLMFSPLGFMLLRGGFHSLVGQLLQLSHLAPEYGRSLSTEPRKWMAKEPTARLAFRSYMRENFIPEYRNNVTAVAFLGTAFLIMTIGLRGIKFLTPHQPDLIILAIIVEISVLCTLGMTTWYERNGETASEDQVASRNKVLIDGEYISIPQIIEMLQKMQKDLEDQAKTVRVPANSP